MVLLKVLWKQGDPAIILDGDKRFLSRCLSWASMNLLKKSLPSDSYVPISLAVSDSK